MLLDRGWLLIQLRMMNDIIKTIDRINKINSITGEVIGDILESLKIQTQTIVSLQSQINDLNEKIEKLQRKKPRGNLFKRNLD